MSLLRPTHSSAGSSTAQIVYSGRRPSTSPHSQRQRRNRFRSCFSALAGALSVYFGGCAMGTSHKRGLSNVQGGQDGTAKRSHSISNRPSTLLDRKTFLL